METIDKYFSDEIQNTVAKLLAKEDVTIQRSYSYKTAFFDVEKRLLGLPVYKEQFPREVYDLFIGHEVGHALFTTKEDIDRFHGTFKKPDLYNVLEDIRIERNIQVEYPGLSSLFVKGYRHLWGKKFFGVENMDGVNRLNFLDRLNIYAKLSAPVLFSDDEQPIVDEAMKVESIDDIIAVARKIIDLVKNNETPNDKRDQESEQPTKTDGDAPNSGSSDEENETENNESDDSAETNHTPEADPESDDGTEAESKKSTDATDDTESESKNIETDGSGNESGDENTSDGEQSVGDKSDPLESETQKSFTESLENSIASNLGYNKTHEFVEPSKEDIYRRVIDYKTVMSARDAEFLSKSNSREIAESYDKFQLESKQAISYLTNQFQQKKAAHQYTRAGRSTRGVIDVNSLYKYKYDDNVFMSNTILADAKSHGLVMMIDFSGSMQGSRILGVVKQTLTMCGFCRRNDIPFSVYTWTDVHGDQFEKEDQKTAFDDKLSLAGTTVHCVLSSDMPKSVFTEASWQLYRIASSGDYRNHNYDMMGGTPICHALLIAGRLLVDLKKQWGVQIMNFMFLTDGEGYQLTKFSSFNNPNPHFSSRSSLSGTHVGRLNGHRVVFKGEHYDVLVNHISKNLKVNTIGIFENEYLDHAVNSAINIMIKHPGCSIYNRKDERNNIRSEFRKNKIAFRENCGGYDKFILVNSSVGNFDLANDYKDGDVKSIQADFLKLGSSKKAKRVFATEIIDSICAQF